MMKVITYARVSTQEQAREGTSLETQRQRLRAEAELQGFDVVLELEDRGYSGTHADRPGLQRLRAALRRPGGDVVAVTKLDRLARNLRLLLELEEEIRQAGARLRAVDEAVDTGTPFGRAVFGILGVVGQWERDRIVERLSEGRQQRYAQGKWASGTVLYGYDYDPVTKTLVVNEGEAAVVRDIFNNYVFQGHSLGGIAQALTKRGVKPRRRARAWHNAAVRDIVVNPAYKGDLVVGRHMQVGYLRHGVPVGATILPVPAIIEVWVWERAQALLTSNRHYRAPRVTPWLFQGKMTCGLCVCQPKSHPP